MSLLVIFDVPRLQWYIFAVPCLRNIIGGSALLDRFDHQSVRNLPWFLSAGGGRGAFESADGAAVDSLERALREGPRDRSGPAHWASR